MRRGRASLTAQEPTGRGATGTAISRAVESVEGGERYALIRDRLPQPLRAPLPQCRERRGPAAWLNCPVRATTSASRCAAASSAGPSRCGDRFGGPPASARADGRRSMPLAPVGGRAPLQGSCGHVDRDQPPPHGPARPRTGNAPRPLLRAPSPALPRALPGTGFHAAFPERRTADGGADGQRPDARALMDSGLALLSASRSARPARDGTARQPPRPRRSPPLRRAPRRDAPEERRPTAFTKRVAGPVPDTRHSPERRCDGPVASARAEAGPGPSSKIRSCCVAGRDLRRTLSPAVVFRTVA